jgi:sugar/nucleoside kinase (ribokinase family)
MDRVAPSGLFVGLTTIDVLHTVERVPAPNEKITATGQTLAAGGPAANAAVTFAHLGGRATLATVIGSHRLTEIIHADLRAYAVRLLDVLPERDEPPPVAAIAVTASSGERAVVSYYSPADELAGLDLLDPVRHSDCVLLDGHYPTLAASVVEAARRCGRPTVFDGGRWRVSIEDLLPGIDIAICSADFRPPGCHSDADVFDYLAGWGIRWAAITHGGETIAWQGPASRGEIPVPAVDVMDTLGAGDVFHGSFCYHFATSTDRTSDGWFTSCLSRASHDASLSCGSVGSRSWMGRS